MTELEEDRGRKRMSNVKGKVRREKNMLTRYIYHKRKREEGNIKKEGNRKREREKRGLRN